MEDFTISELQKYYKQESDGEAVEAVIESLEGDEEVVYGAQSVNVRLPSYLRRITEDWDIYSHTPLETASELERLLDAQFDGDFFSVEPAKHPGTFRVKSKVTGKVIADVTLNDQTVDYQIIDGIKYATLDEQVSNIKRALADQDFRFRWAKDLDTLRRIEVFRQTHPQLEKSLVKQFQAASEEQHVAVEGDEDTAMERQILGKLAPKRRRVSIKPGLEGMQR